MPRWSAMRVRSVSVPSTRQTSLRRVVVADTANRGRPASAFFFELGRRCFAGFGELKPYEANEDRCEEHQAQRCR